MTRLSQRRSASWRKDPSRPASAARYPCRSGCSRPLERSCHTPNAAVRNAPRFTGCCQPDQRDTQPIMEIGRQIDGGDSRGRCGAPPAAPCTAPRGIGAIAQRALAGEAYLVRGGGHAAALSRAGAAREDRMTEDSRAASTHPSVARSIRSARSGGKSGGALPSLARNWLSLPFETPHAALSSVSDSAAGDPR